MRGVESQRRRKWWCNDCRVSFSVTINHSETYVVGDIHTNSIEGFWATIKRAYMRQHHHYTRKYAGLYVAEACFKYNHRANINRKGVEAVFNELTGDILCTSL